MTLIYIDCWYEDNSGHVNPPITLDVRIDMNGDIKSQIYKQRGVFRNMKLTDYRFSALA